ncbi:TetR/AcrR family transcriptional regulator [Sporichthya sp.]|uniref:TetR/AcrR family transcriptional regulator n=1 Tax=Sporichthya sp. TaxID=65475 RepID=UPI0025DC0F2E|nr:TetR/AcrR family transcriptional regulator [Sporichthya sp.]
MTTAAELFAARGYAGTTTRDIAVASGVHESLIFRHFGSKQDLFMQAVAEPFADFVTEYVRGWEAAPVMARSFESLCSEFVAGVFDLFAEHRQVAMALVSARAYELDDAEDALSPFAPLIAQIESVADAEVSARNFGPIDLPVVIRLIIGALMSATMFEDWMFGDQRPHPSRQRLISELTMLMVHGLAHRPEQLVHVDSGRPAIPSAKRVTGRHLPLPPSRNAGRPTA